MMFSAEGHTEVDIGVKIFLAALSRSRSLDVRRSVRPSVGWSVRPGMFVKKLS